MVEYLYTGNYDQIKEKNNGTSFRGEKKVASRRILTRPEQLLLLSLLQRPVPLPVLSRVKAVQPQQEQPQHLL